MKNQSILADLKNYRLAISKVAVANNPAVAFDLLVFKVAINILDDGYCFTGVDVKITQHTYTEDKKSKAYLEFEKIKKNLSLNWLKAEDPIQAYKQFEQLHFEEKMKILSFCVAQGLPAELSLQPVGTHSQYALGLTKVNVADMWRPTTENYFSKITTAELLAIGEELLGTEWVEKWKTAERTQIAEELNDVFANVDSDKYSMFETNKIKNWLPAGMAFSKE